MCPRVFRAPEGPAAREARQPRFARRRASKPALALRSLRRPSHQWGRVADVWLGASPRSPARPCHRPPAPRQIPPAPFTPAALGVLTCGSVRRLVVRPGPAAAHRHRGRSLRRPPHQWCQVADVARCVGLLFGQALPPPTGAAARPWTLGGGCLCRSHSGAFGYALLQTSSIGGVFRVDFCVVVTNVVNPTAFSLKIKVFGRRLTTFVT